MFNREENGIAHCNKVASPPTVQIYIPTVCCQVSQDDQPSDGLCGLLADRSLFKGEMDQLSCIANLVGSSGFSERAAQRPLDFRECAKHCSFWRRIGELSQSIA